MCLQLWESYRLTKESNNSFLLHAFLKHVYQQFEWFGFLFKHGKIKIKYNFFFPQKTDTENVWFHLFGFSWFSFGQKAVSSKS